MDRLVNAIVLHTAASYDFKAKKVLHLSTQQIDRYHREHNGWRMIGYHWYVEHDGHGVPGRRDDEVGAHVGGLNQNTLGLCVSGHGDFQAWSEAQMKEVLRKCHQWCDIYRIPPERVIGHREAEKFGAPPVHKTCPGVMVDMDEIRAKLTEML